MIKSIWGANTFIPVGIFLITLLCFLGLGLEEANGSYQASRNRGPGPQLPNAFWSRFPLFSSFSYNCIHENTGKQTQYSSHITTLHEFLNELPVISTIVLSMFLASYIVCCQSLLFLGFSRNKRLPLNDTGLDLKLNAARDFLIMFYSSSNYIVTESCRKMVGECACTLPPVFLSGTIL